MIKQYCDKCGKELSKENYIIDGDSLFYKAKYEVCDECRKEIIKFIETKKSEEVENKINIQKIQKYNLPESCRKEDWETWDLRNKVNEVIDAIKQLEKQLNKPKIKI